MGARVPRCPLARRSVSVHPRARIGRTAAAGHPWGGALAAQPGCRGPYRRRFYPRRSGWPGGPRHADGASFLYCSRATVDGTWMLNTAMCSRWVFHLLAGRVDHSFPGQWGDRNRPYAVRSTVASLHFTKMSVRRPPIAC